MVELKHTVEHNGVPMKLKPQVHLAILILESTDLIVPGQTALLLVEWDRDLG